MSYVPFFLHLCLKMNVQFTWQAWLGSPQAGRRSIEWNTHLADLDWNLRKLAGVQDYGAITWQTWTGISLQAGRGSISRLWSYYLADLDWNLFTSWQGFNAMEQSPSRTELESPQAGRGLIQWNSHLADLNWNIFTSRQGSISTLWTYYLAALDWNLFTSWQGFNFNTKDLLPGRLGLESLYKLAGV
jgi:hypothetical protein